MSLSLKNPAEILTKVIQDFVMQNPGNRKSKLDGTPYFDTPLVGYAAASDPLFAEFKEIIGGFHLSPLEVLKGSFPEHTDSLDSASVAAWILPITGSTRQSNRKQTGFPSKDWAHTRTYGEEFNNDLRKHVVSF